MSQTAKGGGSIRAARLLAVATLLFSTLLACQADPPDLKSVRVSDMLSAGRHSELGQLMSAAQARYHADIRFEREMDLLLDQFYRPMASMEGPLNSWVDAGGSTESRLARGIYYTAMAGNARGTALARDTEEARWRSMREYNELAWADLTAVVRADPSITHAYCYLIEILQGSGSVDAINAVASEALKTRPLSRTVRMFYVAALTPLWGGSIEEMEAVIEEARSHYDSNPTLMVLEGRVSVAIGDVLYSREQYAEALEYFDAAIEGGGEYWYYFDRRADTKFQLGRYSEAIADYDKALTLRPEYGPLYEWRARSSYRLRDFESTISDLDRAFNLGVGSAQLYMIRGESRKKVGMIEGAVADLDRAIALDPSNAAYRRSRDALPVQLE